MNWNKWLPWRSGVPLVDKESTYGERVNSRCDHSETEWSKTDSTVEKVESPRVEEGFLVFDSLRQKEKYCVDCGELMVGSRWRNEGKIAVPIEYRIDSGASISDSPIIIEDGDGSKVSVLVNQSEQSGFKVTD